MCDQVPHFSSPLQPQCDCSTLVFAPPPPNLQSDTRSAFTLSTFGLRSRWLFIDRHFISTAAGLTRIAYTSSTLQYGQNPMAV